MTQEINNLGEHLWLPYTQMQIAPTPFKVARTSGCKIILEDGRELIDGISSWWSACHGYNHPHIIAEMEKQLKLMPHVMFAGLVHEPAIKLAQRLCNITPAGLNKVFFADSGSVAVEIALKIALQYWRAMGKSNKDRFICFKHGYHGDTLGAMSVSDPERSIHKAFRNAIIKQYVLDIPSDEYSFAEFDSLLAGVSGNIAGLIMEPLVQGAGGMKFHSADTVAEIYRITKKHNILFIADEIATGFGRTGSLFACAEAGITPDIMCLGKALTGGAISMGATLVTDDIFNAFLSDKPEDAFMHGPTFMANPLACSAANASLDLFEKEPRLQQVETIENILVRELTKYESIEGIIDIRVKGAVGVVQVDNNKIDVYALRKKFPEYGVWLRPFRDVVYVMPPFVIREDELCMITETINKLLELATHN